MHWDTNPGVTLMPTTHQSDESWFTAVTVKGNHRAMQPLCLNVQIWTMPFYTNETIPNRRCPFCGTCSLWPRWWLHHSVTLHNGHRCSTTSTQRLYTTMWKPRQARHAEYIAGMVILSGRIGGLVPDSRLRVERSLGKIPNTLVGPKGKGGTSDSLPPGEKYVNDQEWRPCPTSNSGHMLKAESTASVNSLLSLPPAPLLQGDSLYNKWFFRPLKQCKPRWYPQLMGRNLFSLQCKPKADLHVAAVTGNYFVWL